MQYVKYSAYLKTASLGFSELSCPHCGAPVLSLRNKEAICHLCEGFVSTAHEELLQKNEALYSGLFKIHGLIAANSVEDALSLLETISASLPDGDIRPAYGAAVIYALISDYKYYSVNYNLPGFMEENSKNIYTSLDLISKSKKLLYKTIKSVDSAEDGEADESLLYLKFISYIKLKRMADARDALYGFRNLKSTGLQYEYAKMVYTVEAGASDAWGFLQPMLNGSYPNAFAYFARYMAKNEKTAKARLEAKLILSELMKRCYMPQMQFFIRRIDAAEEETKI